MKQAEQIPRNALVWIILSLFTLVAPHIARVPLWVLLSYVVAALWRIQVYRGHWSFPRWPAKLGLIFAAVGGILFSFRSMIGLDPMVALLLAAFALKVLELAERKDAYVLLFLGYFIVLTEFLFSQDLLIVLLCLANVILVTTALVALHRPGEERFTLRPLRKAGGLVVQAIPLMLVLFFVFPRIGPLWTVPMKSPSGVTGMSDTMRPGDVSSLSRSGAVAFRVAFEGEIPPRSQLYWRGLVMSRLEQGAWRALTWYELPADKRREVKPELVGEPLRYSIIMAPTQQRWLYGLRYADSPDSGIMNAPDYRMFRFLVIEDDFLYRVESWPDTRLEVELGDWRRSTELQLPADNPRTRALGERLAAEADAPRGVVDAALNLFSEQEFFYTLQPPLLPQGDGIDAFLFESRRGFCEHFASAFVILMRAAGLPARVVAGYQGGEINPVNRTVVVRQFDAHAWAEVWLPGEGWVKVDPTSVVAPARVELGLEQAVAEEGTFLADEPLSLLRFRGIPLVNYIRLRYDALTYQWQSWIAGFNGEQQLDFLNRLLGDVNPLRISSLVLGGMALALLPAGIALLWRQGRNSLRPHDKLYLQFCARLARMGVVREPGETPRAFARRAVKAVPRLAPGIEAVTGSYEQVAYAGSSAEALEQLAREVRRLR